MSLELVNTLATLGTFLVITATAIAAIVQLRHMRGSNHIAALNELRETSEKTDFLAATQFVQGQLSITLQDPTFRHQLEVPTARSEEGRSLIAKAHAIGNFYEDAGLFVKTGLVDRELLLQIYSEQVVGAWRQLAQVAAIHRRRNTGVWENFEYLTVLAEDWLAAHPKGTYPAGVRRIDLKDNWFEADKQFAAALAPA